MLAHHLIVRPVFEALFENYSFVKNNPVSQSLEQILTVLDTKDTAEDRQKIIIELYDKFFKTALPMTVERLGIVYTPVEVVDFILRSVDEVLYKNFGRRLSDKNVHVLDPFAGTGTFIVRLIQSNLIHAFHDAAQIEDYQQFAGICLTDTFQAAV